jgi:hypothetical protein
MGPTSIQDDQAGSIVFSAWLMAISKLLQDCCDARVVDVNLQTRATVEGSLWMSSYV